MTNSEIYSYIINHYQTMSPTKISTFLGVSYSFVASTIRLLKSIFYFNKYLETGKGTFLIKSNMHCSNSDEINIISPKTKPNKLIGKQYIKRVKKRCPECGCMSFVKNDILSKGFCFPSYTCYECGHEVFPHKIAKLKKKTQNN